MEERARESRLETSGNGEEMESYVSVICLLIIDGGNNRLT